jgi:ribonuclease HII
MAMIVGIDEVGRGSWAGPLCVAAVAWPDGAKLKGLADSKLIPAAKRPAIATGVRLQAFEIGVGWVSAMLIDTIGISEALKMAARQAVGQLTNNFESIIIDGNFQLLDDVRSTTVIKADTTIPAVMAASVVAKVARDNYMHALDRYLGNYQFSRHVGYGTALHKTLLAQFGPCALHRMSYAPLRAYAAQ